MADHIVKPIGKETILIKCKQCKTLYSPKDGVNTDKHFYMFEKCPVCGYERNEWKQVIPLWKYNLIKAFRGMFNHG